MKKTIIRVGLLLSFFFLTGIAGLSAQGNSGNHGNGHGRGHDKDWKEDKEESREGNPGNGKHHGPPPWAPAHGYKHRHIYFPDYQCYYDNNRGVYITNTGGRWAVSAEIPKLLIGVNLSGARKVELDMDLTDSPQIKFSEHIALYPKR